MVRGVVANPDQYGRIRVSDLLCVARDDIDLQQVQNGGLDLAFGNRQFIVTGQMRFTQDARLLFPGENVPEDAEDVPVLFLVKRYEVRL